MGMEFLTDQNTAMLLAGFAAFAAIIGLAMPAPPDARLQARLRNVAQERDRLREKRLSELAISGKGTIRKDNAGQLAGALKRFAQGSYSHSGDLSRRLVMAGFRGQGAQALFLFCRTALPVGFFLCTFAVLAVFQPKDMGWSAYAAISLAATLLGFSFPQLILDRLIARRQKAILRAFPDALDLLLISVQSGMSVESALNRVTKDISGQCIELAEELSLTMAELSYLPVRWRAYANLGERIGLPAVKLITAALVQAEKHGTSISQALSAAAREGRDARINNAEQKAAALPPKLAVPLVVFFLPVLLTVILAPALMQAGDAMKQRGAIISPNRNETGTHRQNARSSQPAQARSDRQSP